jgi:hypothetical protein
VEEVLGTENDAISLGEYININATAAMAAPESPPTAI